jgi:hypothetical protein
MDQEARMDLNLSRSARRGAVVDEYSMMPSWKLSKILGDKLMEADGLTLMRVLDRRIWFGGDLMGVLEEPALAAAVNNAFVRLNQSQEVDSALLDNIALNRRELIGLVVHEKSAELRRLLRMLDGLDESGA